jgi:intein/homing endonuclease
MIDFDRENLARAVIIKDVIDHPNADRLDIITIDEWQCVVAKGTFKVSDLVVYFEIDSILPQEIEEKIFGKDANVKLKGSRVRTIKLRKAISQGLAVPQNVIFGDGTPNTKHKVYAAGTDLTKILKIGKYVPTPKQGSVLYTQKFKKSSNNENFTKMRKPAHLKTVGGFDGEEVMITEKIHGCFEGNTRITLADGSTMKIKNIVDNKLIVDVLTMDKYGEASASTVKNWFINGSTKRWFNVKIDGCNTGRKGGKDISVKCTENHEFYEVNSGLYKKVCELTNEDTVIYALPYDKPNEIQESILIGKMIGDGSLSMSNSIDFGHKKDHEEYVDYTLSALGDFAGNKQKDQVSGYGTIMSRAKSKAGVGIKRLFNNWVGDKKEIPIDIKLDPISVAFWYMDDGSLMHDDKQSDRAMFSTCNFSEKSVDNLISALRRCLGITGVKSYTDKKYWRIRINKDSAKLMFDKISPYICDCMKYKLPDEYKNIERKYISGQKSQVSFYYSNCKVISVEHILRVNKMNLKKYDIETEDHNYYANGILVHNSSFVAGWIERENRTLSQKINKFLFGNYVFCWRSMNVQLQGDDSLFTNIKRKLKLKKEVYMSKTLYGRICLKYDLKNKLFHGQVITGEIYGSGIQNGYTYGCAEGEQRLAAFGFREHGKECTPFVVMDYLNAKRIPSVPILYVGMYDKKIVEECTVGRSVLDQKTKVREGCVVVTLSGKAGLNGNCIVKNINPEYLLGEQSEFN